LEWVFLLPSLSLHKEAVSLITGKKKKREEEEEEAILITQIEIYEEKQTG
jgi:hypothetical protein